MKFNRLRMTILGFALLYGVLYAKDAVDKSEPVLRIGVISDMQCVDLENDRGLLNTRKGFEFLAARKIDVLINPGDIAQRAEPGVYSRYMKAFKEVFEAAGKLPVQVAIPGNHDFWHKSKLSSDECLKNFADGMEEKDVRLIHKSVNGYEIIGISALNLSGSGVNRKEAQQALKKAEEASPDKPIFVVTHFPPEFTVAGSFPWGNYEVRKLLEAHPRAVSLSGHTHVPIADERVIWQGGFTAIGCGSVNYCQQPEHGIAKGALSADLKRCNEILYLEVFPTRIDVYRYHLLTGEEIKPHMRWRVDLPYSPEKAVYGTDRGKRRKAPEFQPGAKAVVEVIRKGVRINFDAAKHDDFVLAYRFRIYEMNVEKIQKELLWFSDCCDGLSKGAEELTYRFPAAEFVPGKGYRIDIVPIESFGQEGKPLTVNFSIPSDFRFRKSSPKLK